jgi:hypothetical protein
MYKVEIYTFLIVDMHLSISTFNIILKNGYITFIMI